VKLDDMPDYEGGTMSSRSEGEKEFPWTLEVALSGGGFRAAAFSLGALLYLAHTGLNTKVKNISSVSGGSITNAVVAHRCSFEQCSLSDFKKLAIDLSEKFASRGLFENKLAQVHCLAAILAATALLLTSGAALLSQLGIHLGWDKDFWFFPIIVVESIIVVAILYIRSWPIGRWMGSTFFGKDCGSVTLGALSSRAVDHVFCTTDLVFSRPFFFSTANGGRQVFERYGQANAPDVTLLTAVRASSAFPPLIPPIRYRTKQFWGVADDKRGMVALRMNHPLWLTDGGVFNNYGTEWQRLRGERWLHELAHKHVVLNQPNKETFNEHVRRRYGQVQLVIDAGQVDPPSNGRILAWPVLGWIAYVFKIIGVMYGSTLSGRSMNAGDVAKQRIRANPQLWQPSHPSFDPASDKSDDGNQGALKIYVPYTMDLATIYTQWGHALPRDADALASIQSYRYAFEDDEKRFGALWPNKEMVRTTFSSLGMLTTTKLLIAGYVATRTALKVALDYCPNEMPDPQWFGSA
jgi:hypothetical protein